MPAKLISAWTLEFHRLMNRRKVKQSAVRGITSIVMLGGLLLPSASSVAGAGWWGRTLQHSTLNLKSGHLGADISPDSRFLAVYAVNSEDLPGRGKDETIYEIQIWDWRAGKIIARKIVSRERPFDAQKQHAYEHFVRYADGGTKLVVYQEGHVFVLDSASLDEVRNIDLEMSLYRYAFR